MKKKTLMWIFWIFVASVMAAAAPDGGVTIIQNASTRAAVSPPSISAASGNISSLILDGESVTQSWQGYVGNVTGTITLDDQWNYTLYDWTLADPSGEVYATYLSTVDWTKGYISCWNWSNTTAGYLQLSELEEYPGAGAPNDFSGMYADSDDVDGMNETFNYTYFKGPGMREHTSFYVGEQLINGTLEAGSFARGPDGGGGPCPNVRIYNGTHHGGVQSPDDELPSFEEVLLYQWKNEGNGDGVIFTSILQSDANGYNNQSWDFQMLVPENGHNGNTTSTTYYFYVELE